MAPSQSSGECKDPAQKGTERALPNQSWGQWLELRAVGGDEKKGGIQGELAISGARCGRELNMEASSVAEGTARHEFREELHG